MSKPNVILTSVTHEAVKRIVRLHTTAGRKEAQAFLVEGRVFIESFIKYGYTLLFLYCTQEVADKDPLDSGTLQYVSQPVMNKMSQATTPSGYLAVFKKPLVSDFSQLSSGLVLAQLNDPGNMGTLIRSAAAFGYKTVVVVEGCDPFSYKVIQATAGTLPLVNLIQCSWQELKYAANNKYDLVALVPRGGKAPHEFNAHRSLFIVGSEAHGLPEAWIQDSTYLCTLSMVDFVESLNAAVAGSLVIALASRSS